jgi:anti-sigma B factor antagonist
MLEITHMDEVLVVRLKDGDRLNESIAIPVREKLLELFSKPNIRLVFDLEGITFIDSSGFGVFLAAVKAASHTNGQFKICNLSGELVELFKLLQLHHVMEIYDRLEACLLSFEQ